MLQIMKYHFRILLRNREQMFWILLFPILLGIMFKVAFSNISSSEKLYPTTTWNICRKAYKRPTITIYIR